jgi:hypothetical protein
MMARYSKFFVAAIAAVGVLLSSGPLPANVATWVNVVVAAASAALVYLGPNAQVRISSNASLPRVPKGDKPGEVPHE